MARHCKSGPAFLPAAAAAYLLPLPAAQPAATHHSKKCAHQANRPKHSHKGVYLSVLLVCKQRVVAWHTTTLYTWVPAARVCGRD